MEDRPKRRGSPGASADYSAVITMIQDGNDYALDEYLKKNYGILNMPIDSNGNTLLHIAVTANKPGIVKVLCTYREINLSTPNNDQKTAIDLCNEAIKECDRKLNDPNENETVDEDAEKINKKNLTLMRAEIGGRAVEVIPLREAARNKSEIKFIVKQMQNMADKAPGKSATAMLEKIRANDLALLQAQADKSHWPDYYKTLQKTLAEFDQFTAGNRKIINGDKSVLDKWGKINDELNKLRLPMLQDYIRSIPKEPISDIKAAQKLVNDLDKFSSDHKETLSLAPVTLQTVFNDLKQSAMTQYTKLFIASLTQEVMDNPTEAMRKLNEFKRDNISNLFSNEEAAKMLTETNLEIAQRHPNFRNTKSTQTLGENHQSADVRATASAPNLGRNSRSNDSEEHRQKLAIFAAVNTIMKDDKLNNAEKRDEIKKIMQHNVNMISDPSIKALTDTVLASLRNPSPTRAPDKAPTMPSNNSGAPKSNLFARQNLERSPSGSSPPSFPGISLGSSRTSSPPSSPETGRSTSPASPETTEVQSPRTPRK